MAVKVETGAEFSSAAPVQLFEGPFSPQYDVARDGRFLMIQQSPSSTEGAASIVVVQNWFEELKRLVPTE